MARLLRLVVAVTLVLFAGFWLLTFMPWLTSASALGWLMYVGLAAWVVLGRRSRAVRRVHPNGPPAAPDRGML